MKGLSSMQATRTRPRGFSIIELLIALIIIGILVTILIPVISGRSNEARLARCGQDLESLANAEERLVLDTGYMSPLFFLNDVRGGDGIVFEPESNTPDPIDGVRDYPLNTRIFIDPETQDFVPDLVGQTLLLRLQENETNFGWKGPYVNWHRDLNYEQNDGDRGPDGIPDDPWGNNYTLFTRQGVVVETGFPADVNILSSSALPVTNPDGQGTYTCINLFDRPTIVSFGPNGLPGDGTGPASDTGQPGRGDDIIRKFGY